MSALAFSAKASWGYPPDVMESWRSELRVSREALQRASGVACAGEAIVGFYVLAPAPLDWELDHLWVDPTCQRRGIGRSLLHHALDAARRGGAHRVCVDSDPNAEAFYRACGAHRTGSRPAPICGEPQRIRPQLRFELDAPA